MMAALFGGYSPRHARRRGRYKAVVPQPSAGLYGLCIAFLAAAAMWPLPAGVVT